MTSAAPTTSVACGIDIGGSGVKSALVDLTAGTFIGERVRIDTPEEATPEAVAGVCRQLLEQLQVGDDVPVGVALPAPIVHGTVPFMANLDKSWTGVNLTELMREHLGRPVTGLNDADAAGLAEVAFGAAKDVPGTIIVTTLAPGSAQPSSSTERWSPTPSSGTWRLTGTTPRPGPPPASARLRTCPGRSGPSVSSATTPMWRCSSPRTCSSWAGVSPASTRSTCRCSTSRPRSSRPSCSTRPALSGPPTRPPGPSRSERSDWEQSGPGTVHMDSGCCAAGGGGRPAGS